MALDTLRVESPETAGFKKIAAACMPNDGADSTFGRFCGRGGLLCSNCGKEPTVRRKKVIAILTALLVVSGVWLFFNPPGRFGWGCYAYTTYGSIPRPVSDLQVRCDGAVRTVDKTHDLAYDHVRWLLDPMPEILIVGTGWDGVTVPRSEVKNLQGCEVEVLETGDALDRYNRLKREGRKVAIHVHSTC